MWPFKTKRTAGLPSRLPYKSGRDFFEMQCKYGHTEVRENVGVVGLVLDAKKEFGVSVAVKVNDDGSQKPVLRIASDDGGFVTIATTASAKGDRLKPDDVVIWVPELYLPDLAREMSDPRAGWVGVIVAKVAPELGLENDEMRILCRYD